MKHSFLPSQGIRNDNLLFAQCSISHHLVMDRKTAKPRLFKSVAAVEKFSAANTGTKLTDCLFKDCANALLARNNAILEHEEACNTGSQKTFRHFTRFGPALVTPVDSWIIFRFLEPEGKSFPWAMSGKAGQWNFHSQNGDLSALLDEFALGLAQCTPIIAGAAPPSTGKREVLPACVMQSQAGYYVGCYVRTDEGDYPHSRFSQYFSQKRNADEWLTNSLGTCSL